MAENVSKDVTAKAKKKRTNPAQFINEVRQEIRKVTWPTRNETITTTISVYVMVTLAAVFFFFADVLISQIIQFIFGLAG